MNLKIAFDIDGVLADFSGRFCEFLRFAHGEHLPILIGDEDIIDYDWKFYPLENHHVQQAFEDILHIKDFWLTLSPKNVDEFKLVHESLKDKKIDVYFITSRHTTCGPQTPAQESAAWLRKMGWENPNVIVSFNKGAVVNALGINYFIDDHGSNCLDVLKFAPLCNTYLLNCAHNKEYNIRHPQFKRVNNVTDFVNDVVAEYEHIKSRR